MVLDEVARQQLTGGTFDAAGTVHVVRQRGAVPDRLAVIEGLARGRRVLHVGCVDHLDLLDWKIARGLWLHGRLQAVAKECVGVDLSEDGIAELRRRGVSDVFVANVSEEGTDHGPVRGPWDLVVLGEVIEHVDDPVAFLSALRGRYLTPNGVAVLSTPNALSIRNFMGAARGREVINTDHRYWFSPYTISKVATRAGFDVAKVRLCEYYPPSTELRGPRRLPGLASELLLRRLPLLRPCLVVELRSSEPRAVAR